MNPGDIHVKPRLCSHDDTYFDIREVLAGTDRRLSLVVSHVQCRFRRAIAAQEAAICHHHHAINIRERKGENRTSGRAEL